MQQDGLKEDLLTQLAATESKANWRYSDLDAQLKCHCKDIEMAKVKTKKGSRELTDRVAELEKYVLGDLKSNA